MRCFTGHRLLPESEQRCGVAAGIGERQGMTHYLDLCGTCMFNANGGLLEQVLRTQRWTRLLSSAEAVRWRWLERIRRFCADTDPDAGGDSSECRS